MPVLKGDEVDQSLAAGGGWAPLRPAAWLRVTGEDALSFLQGQCTQELRPDRAPPVVYGLWLNQKGKVVGDSFVVRRDGGEWWLLSYGTGAAGLRERLESYVIADDVGVEDRTAEAAGVTVLGAGGAAALAGVVGELPPAGQWRVWRGALILGGRRGVVPAYEVVGAPADLELAGLPELSAEALARARIAAGVPWVPVDVGAADLPNEAGLDAEAIAYTKGCYLGQEVMARLKAMGQVRRSLRRVRGEGAVPAALPAGLEQAGKRVGELRSAVARADGGGWMGLAMVSLMQLNPAVPLGVAGEGGGAGEAWVEGAS